MNLIDRAALIRRLKDHADGKSDFYKSAILTDVMFAEEAPTIEAVPLDKLCDLLSKHVGKIRCNDCWVACSDPCPGTADDWRRVITKWMEGQHEQDQ